MCLFQQKKGGLAKILKRSGSIDNLLDEVSVSPAQSDYMFSFLRSVFMLNQQYSSFTHGIPCNLETVYKSRPHTELLHSCLVFLFVRSFPLWDFMSSHFNHFHINILTLSWCLSYPSFLFSLFWIPQFNTLFYLQSMFGDIDPNKKKKKKSLLAMLLFRQTL